MRNQEFIQSNKIGSFQNLFRDEDGTLYSYGSHYPLKWEIDGITFRNISGYSATTRKHIYYTVADYDVNLYLSNHTHGKPTKEQTIRALEKDIVNLLTEMAKKKRTNTQVYQRLEREVSKRTSAFKALTKN